MLSRKKFIQKTALTATAGLSLLEWMQPVQAAAWQEQLENTARNDPYTAARDEDFWNFIREQYATSTTIINLNNGGVSPQPMPVQEAHIRNYQFCNEVPAYNMWRLLDHGRENMRSKLAELAGCSTDEIAINRNTTEGLNSVIFGLNLKAGDEVVLSKYDYPNMMNAWKQREKRDGIKLKWVDFELPAEDDNAIVEQYQRAITAQTKIVHITHLINWTGQIMPVRKIADMAHSKGCDVIADGAHTFAHIDYRIPQLGCDYYATSLHKWLCAPFGTGMLYIKKEKIKNVWPLLSAPEPDSDNIRKFENLGTRSTPAEMAISNAIDFQYLVGTKRKEERLRYLTGYWYGKLKPVKGLKFYTSFKPEYSCAIACFNIEGWEPDILAKRLHDDYAISTTSINHEKVKGVRITPHVYTSLSELDRFATAVTALAAMGPPKK